MTDLSYPIGRAQMPAQVTPELRAQWLADIAALPAALRQAVAGLTDAQLDTPYRPDGWTVRQVVHHLADSHMNAFIRLKLALTESTPKIKPYEEKLWAETAEAKSGPVAPSLALIEGLHQRWVALYQSLSGDQWPRTWVHPETPDRPRTIDTLLAVYSWHGRHHVAHINGLRERSGW